MAGPRSNDKQTGRQGLRGGSSQDNTEKLKQELHHELIDSLDFEKVGNTTPDELRTRLKDNLTTRLEARNLPLSRLERNRIIEELLDNILGYGPLEIIFRDPEITDIMINGPKRIFVEKKGKLILHEVTFEDNKHLMQIIDRIVSAVGRRVDETNPMVDARMLDGSRFNAIIPPLALDGACVSIRRFAEEAITAAHLINWVSVPKPIMMVLQGCVRAKMNILISGGTGSGKTTLLNVLSSFIPDGERLITIEDSAELQMQQSHVVRLETRAANLEGKGAIDQRQLLINCLRMRPDRIILGEIRGGEAIDMLQAMNTGHDGSLATIHSNSASDAVARLETLVGIGMPNLTDKSIRETIARSVHLVIQIQRLTDGSRRLLSLTEIMAYEDGKVRTQDIFVFEKRTIDDKGKQRGAFKATGNRPLFAKRLSGYGIELAPELWTWSMEV